MFYIVLPCSGAFIINTTNWFSYPSRSWRLVAYQTSWGANTALPLALLLKSNSLYLLCSPNHC